MKIGLFFGSFNPVHIGHMIIANFMASQTDLEQLWLVVSPQNPLKEKDSLANNYDRLHLVRLAIGDNPLLRPCDVEFFLPIPSYTIDTLDHLEQKHPDDTFVIIMGGDSLANLHRWKSYERLIDNHEIYVYARPGYDLGELSSHDNVTVFKAPLIQISATYIRSCIQRNLPVEYLVPAAVNEYLENSTMYKNRPERPSDKK